MSDPELETAKLSVEDSLHQVKSWLVIAAELVHVRGLEGDSLSKFVSEQVQSSFDRMTAEGINMATVAKKGNDHE